MYAFSLDPFASHHAIVDMRHIFASLYMQYTVQVSTGDVECS